MVHLKQQNYRIEQITHSYKVLSQIPKLPMWKISNLKHIKKNSQKPH